MSTPSGAFTDKNVKELKDSLPLIETYGRWLTNRDKVEALLHRLEAAEVCAMHLQHMEPKCDFVKAWRKSKWG